jgi:hypothetical protein
MTELVERPFRIGAAVIVVAGVVLYLGLELREEPTSAI